MTEEIIVAYKRNLSNTKFEQLVKNLEYDIKDIDFLIKECILKNDIVKMNILLSKANSDDLEKYADYANKIGKKHLSIAILSKIELDIEFFLNLYNNAFVKNIVSKYLLKYFDEMEFEDFDEVKQAKLIKNALEERNISY